MWNRENKGNKTLKETTVIISTNIYICISPELNHYFPLVI